MDGAFTVKAAQFEGPLDLLLNLIEERKLLITDVTLAQVADGFLTYISEKDSFPIGETAQFIVVASSLLLLKSRSLLPVLTLSDEEEGDIHDLETRLKLLQIIRTASRALAGHRAQMYFGDGVRDHKPLFAPSPDLSVEALRAGAMSALQNAPTKTLVEEVEVKKIMSLDEMIERMTERVQRAISMSFKEFAQGATDPREVVVGFLAMLELVKRGFAHVSQGEHLSDITIEYAGSADTPRYE